MNIVQFPGLGGLEFAIRRWAFEVFGIQIYWYGIIIAFGFLLAVVLAIRHSRQYDLNPDNLLDLVLFAAPVSIVTARLYYVIFSWDQFKDNILSVFNTRRGGLAIYGAVIGAFLVAYIYARYKKIGFLRLVDFGVPYLVMAQGIGRWGNFVNQEAFGTMTSLPWRMNGDVPNAYLNSLQQGIDLSKWGVHPTFLYESLWDLAVFALLLWFRKRKKLNGEVISLYLICYGLGRAFIEGLRTDSLYLGSTGIRISQLLSILLVIVFTVLFIYRRTKKEKAEEENEVEEAIPSQYAAVLRKMQEEEESDKNLSHMTAAEDAETADSAETADADTPEAEPGSGDQDGASPGKDRKEDDQ